MLSCPKKTRKEDRTMPVYWYDQQLSQYVVSQKSELLARGLGVLIAENTLSKGLLIDGMHAIQT
jgi:hypothetical protein